MASPTIDSCSFSDKNSDGWKSLGLTENVKYEGFERVRNREN